MVGSLLMYSCYVIFGNPWNCYISIVGAGTLNISLMYWFLKMHLEEWWFFCEGNHCIFYGVKLQYLSFFFLFYYVRHLYRLWTPFISYYCIFLLYSPISFHNFVLKASILWNACLLFFSICSLLSWNYLFMPLFFFFTYALW